jgi:hypothetical protein
MPWGYDTGGLEAERGKVMPRFE